MTNQRDITEILQNLRHLEGEGTKVGDDLYDVVYHELRRIAGRLMRGERAEHTFQPTDLVHEAYLKLIDQTRVTWQDRAHFFAIAARIMRRILVDHARRKARLKHGGGAQRVTWTESIGVQSQLCLETLALDTAMSRLAELDPRMEKVVELKVFGGLTIREIAHALDVSTRTVDDDWRVAKQWLSNELSV